MSATRLFLTVPRQQARAAFAALDLALEEGGLPLAIREPEEEPLAELAVYVEEEPERIDALMQAALASVGITSTIEREVLPDIDWVSRSLEGLKPVRAGRFLVHGAHDRPHRRPSDLGIEIEAGQAFGTGHHGTTAGCLETIARVARVERPRHALDLGTGSAVLAIGIAKLCHVPVLATDIDPVAVRVAAENVVLNGAGAAVRTVVATGFAHREVAARAPFDLIVANILARPLMRLAPDFARHLSPGGSVILSGILDRQRMAVIAAFVGQRFRHVRTISREGWVTIHLKR